MRNQKPSKAKQVALSGMLFALAMALSFAEGALTIPGLLPGMKLGLANVVVMYALLFMGVRQALVLDVLKALFVFLVSGATGGFLSLCGNSAADGKHSRAVPAGKNSGTHCNRRRDRL